MTLSREAIEELKDIYREDYGIILDDEEVIEYALPFFNLMKVSHKPIPRSYDK